MRRSWNQRFRVTALTIAVAELSMVLLSGCRVQPRTPRTERAIKGGEQVGNYGRVRPQELNENLTPQQLERMFIALEDIPIEGLWEGEDSNRAILPSVPKPVGPNSKLQARKVYLQGRNSISHGAFEEAIAVLEKGLELDPNSAAIHEWLSKAYYNQGNYSAAELAARRTLLFDNDNMTAYHILGNIRLGQRRLARALSFYDRALSSRQATSENPTTVILHLQRARVLREMDYLDAAAKEYKHTYTLLYQQRHYIQADVAVDTLARQVHLPLLAMVSLYIQMGQIEQAVQALMETEKLFSAHVDLVHAFVVSLANQRKPIQIRFRQVTIFCRYLIAVRYEVEHILDMYYEACRKMAKYQDYVDTLHHWYAPKCPDRRILPKREYAYGLYLAERNEQAEALWLELTAQPPGPETALVHRDLAHLYRRKHTWKKMLLHYGWFLEMQPMVIDVLSEKIEELASSISDMNSLLVQWKNDETLCGHYGSSYLLGLLAEQQGDPEGAEFYYQQCLSVQKDFESARTRLFDLLLKRQQYSTLIHWIQQYNSGEQVSPLLHWYAGKAYAGMGQFPEAVRCFQQGIEQDAEHIQAYLDLSEVWIRQRNFVQAEEILQDVMRIWPGRQEVDPYLLILYAVWSAQPCQNDSFHPAAETRACQIMNVVCKKEPATGTLLWKRTSPVSPEVKHVISVLSEFVRKYPDGRTLGMIFARLLFDAGEYEQAVQEIDRVLAQYPEHTQTLSMGALFHEKTSDYAQAGELYQRIWQQRRNDPNLLVKALATLDQGGKSHKALELLLSAWQQSAWQDRHTIQILQPQALRLFQVTRRYEQAVKFYQAWRDIARRTEENKTDDKDDMYRWITEHWIWALIESGDYPRAFREIKTYQKQYEPNEPPWAIYLIQTLNIRLQYGTSVKWLHELLQLAPESESLRLHYYLTLIQQGHEEEALAEAELWAARQPVQKYRLHILTFLFCRVGQYENAAQRLRQYIDSEPKDYDIRFNLIDILRENRRYDEAENVLSEIPQKGRWLPLRIQAQIKIDIARGQWQKALDRIDNLAKGKKLLEAEQLKVEILISSGQVPKAVERIQTLMEKNPDKNIRLLWYSNILAQQEKTEEAIKLLESLLQKRPHDAILKNNLAYTLIEANREPQRARRLLEESLHVDPVSESTLDSMGWLYYKEGDFEQAMSYIYQAAAMLEVPDPEVLDHLADTVYRLGRRQQARRYWQQAASILEFRLPTEGDLRKDIEKIEEKIRQLNEGKEVVVTPLFGE